MKILKSCIFLVLPLLISCSAYISTYTNISDKSLEFKSEELKNGGLAMVPVSGGNRFYSDIVERNANEFLHTKLDSIYIDPSKTSGILNKHNLVQSYRSAMNTYEETGITEQKSFLELGKVLHVRYLLRIKLEGITSEKEIQGGGDNIQTYESRKSRLYAQIWDCSNGEIVWEGNAWSQAEENMFKVIDQTNEEFVQRATNGLMDHIFKN